MVSDSIPPSSASYAKDCNKKKRANRSAKLKQCKMDARREQWLSQVKSKGVKEDVEERCEVVGDEPNNNKGIPLETKLEVKPRGDEKGGDGQEGPHEGSDSESSPLNSPGSVTSSVLSGSNISGTHFTGSSAGSSASSGGTCSGTVTEDEEEEEKEEKVDESDECVDDWEAIADALSDNDKKHASKSDLPNDQQLSPSSESSFRGLEKVSEVPKSQPQRASSNFNKGGMRAWRTDDAFRPHGLPNLAKQRSLPMKSSTSRHFVRGAAGLKSFNNNTTPAASACDCPICYEELDFTDSSFFPCPCGFRMCLFCYKRICEDDGRCPGCRKHYKNKEPMKDGDMTVEGMAHDCSTVKDQRK